MRILYSLVTGIFLYACSPQQTSGPEEMRWDRQTCTRCAMAIGDNKFAAQIRGGTDNQIYRFDDIGCAVIWLDGQSWKNDANTEIWVADYRKGQWIEAREAWFDRDWQSPMGYGLGARYDQGENSLSFSAAVEDIHATEKRTHMHTGQHRHSVDSSK